MRGPPRLATAVVCFVLGLTPLAEAQTETASVAARGASVASTGALEAQRSELVAQRDELEAQRAALEALARRLQDMEELQLADPAVETDPSEAQLDVYGFFETGLQRTWMNERAFLYGLQQTPGLSFILGNLHLYLDARPAPGWRALFEVRLTTSHGALAQGNAGLLVLRTTERRINEPGIGTSGTQLTSSLVLERAQIEWRYDDWLAARIGLWLTPFGIWNVDHGAPTLIPLIAPYFLQIQTFPTHQIGLALFGQVPVSSWQLSYHVAVSNGRMTGPGAAGRRVWPSFDLTDDKMISGRLMLGRSGARTLRFGVSAYWGRTAEDARDVRQLDPIRLTQQIGVELEEWGVGADVSWDPWRLRLRAEFLYSEFRYPGARPASALYPTDLEPDSAQSAGYLLVSLPLELGSIGFEPYLYAEALWQPPTFAPLDLGGMASAGFNVDLTTNVRFKLQYGWQFLFEATNGEVRYSAIDRVHLLSSRVVVSF